MQDPLDCTKDKCVQRCNGSHFSREMKRQRKTDLSILHFSVDERDGRWIDGPDFFFNFCGDILGR